MSEATAGAPPASSADARRFPCAQCGAKLVYQPGTAELRCEYCGHQNTIPQSAEQIREEDFRAQLAELARKSEGPAAPTIKCSACAAEVSRPPALTALRCPFCGAEMVDAASRAALIPPRSLLPFRIARAEAEALFRKWIAGRWFAPSRLRRFARQSANIAGMYVPYWTYDCFATTWYTGERGDNYTHTYTTTDSNGQTKTHTETRTRWTSVSGTVFNNFDDLLILASQSLPSRYTEALEPWDLAALAAYAEEYLSGFQAERYQIGLEDGFERAKVRMQPTIHSTICSDIGGDHQRVSSTKSQYERITFKHLLLPIWISAYRFRDKTYRFLVNARTGEVQGERPWSWIKITLTVLASVLAVGGLIWYIASQQ